jgi:phage terminase small subunit
VVEYCRDFNGAKAAIRAGYTKDNAKSVAHHLLQDALVREGIEVERKKLEEVARLSSVQLIEELKLLAFSDVSQFGVDPATGDIIPPEDNPEAMRAIQSVKKRAVKRKDGTLAWDVDIRLWDKVAAIRMLGQYLGLWDAEKFQASQGPGVLLVQGLDLSQVAGRPAQVLPASGSSSSDEAKLPDIPS